MVLHRIKIMLDFEGSKNVLVLFAENTFKK
jgi:hypothetical protein